jgi:hypothetical protein
MDMDMDVVPLVPMIGWNEASCRYILVQGFGIGADEDLSGGQSANGAFPNAPTDFVGSL